MLSEPGFRVFTRRPIYPNREVFRTLLQELTAAEIASVVDAMNGFGAMHSDIRPIAGFSTRVAGPALTVKVPPGDHLMIPEAMSLGMPGDILVIDGRGDTSRALWGGNVAAQAAHARMSGVVIDGAVRDVHQINESGLPVFARGVTPTRPSFAGLGEVNVLISCGGVVVAPGDIVLLDSDGAAVIPLRDLDGTAARLRKIMNKERSSLSRSRTGELLDLPVVRELMKQRGVARHDSTWDE